MEFFKRILNFFTSNDETFEDWPMLPEHIKRLIISKMDSETRSTLGVCSKSDSLNVMEAEWIYFDNMNTVPIEMMDCGQISTEDNFEDWNYLPNEIKQLIISKMDYFTRLNLSLCSKSENQRVKKERIEINMMTIDNQSGEIDKSIPVKCVDLSIWFDPLAIDCLNLRFFEKDGEDGKCYLMVGRDQLMENLVEKPGIYKNLNYEMVAFNTIRRFLEMSGFKLKFLSIQMDSHVLKTIFLETLMSVTEFQISTGNFDYLLWWLDKLGQMNSLLVFLVNAGHQETMTTIKKLESHNSSYKYYTFHAGPMFSEEQFLNLKFGGMHVSIDNRSNVTNRTINIFIKKWINGEVGNDFSELTMSSDDGFDKNEILEGIEDEEWDDAFREKE